MKLLILIIFSSCLFAYPPAKKIRMVSYKEYRLALRKLYRKNYRETLFHVERSLRYHPGNRKSRELLFKLRQIGADSLETGEALVYFDKKLALQYLTIANILVHPAHQKRRNRIKDLISHIRVSGELSENADNSDSI
ncbi:MAG: hypothetical protein JXA66_00405 [Oligoflexia bacterium]|nr:hypothetical protein [Oligoflexia bacterium]